MEMQLKEARRCFSRIGFVYVVYMIVSTLSQWLAALILTQTGLAERMDWNLYMLIAMLSMYPAAVPLAALMMRWVPAKGRAVRMRWSIGKLGAFFLFSLGVLEAGNLFGSFLMALAGLIKGEPIINEIQELIISMDPWIIFISAVIAAPVMEELVFRKFLLDRIGGYGCWTAMVVSGLIFGIAHGNFYQFFYAFGLGMIFAYVYLHTGKIIYTIVFHMLINFMGSIVPVSLIKAAEFNPAVGGLLAIGNLMLIFGYMICSVVLGVCCWRDLSFYPGPLGLTPSQKIRAIWLNAGMILFLLGGAYLFVRSL